MRPQKLLAREDDEREHTKLLLKGFESDGESSLNLACALVKDHIMKNKKAFIEGSRVAEVARARERRSPKSLDSDENFKP